MPRTKLSNGHAKSSNTQNHLAKTKSLGEKIQHIIPKKHKNRHDDCKKNFNDIKRLGMIVVTLSVFYQKR